ncbi:MAG TPA: DUF503 domain-containing protein [Candidatus Omnitrophota bacterium]|nr:DUF503 domain-containing protein [Candidatus Omnitrophota bacterium]
MREDVVRHIGVLSVSVHIPQSQSLKDKRMVIKGLKERCRNRFNVSVCEVDGHDKWQVATLAFAMVGTDHNQLDQCFQKILSLLQASANLELCDHAISYC